MASNILSRLLPSAGEDPERIPPARHPDEESGDPDLEHVDDARFEDQDLAQLLAEGMEDDMPITDDTHSVDERDLPRRSIKRPSGSDRTSRNGKQPMRPQNSRPTDDEDDVPSSLLLGGTSDRRRKRKSSKGQSVADLPTAMAIPGPDTRTTRAQWEATRAQQQLHNDLTSPPSIQPITGNRLRPTLTVDAKEKAMWAWVNVGNLDNHLTWVYRYYEQHGIWSHLLDKGVRYFTAMFVVWLSTFMFYCIDYSKLPGSTKFEQVRVPHCTEKLPWYWNLFIWGFVIVLVYKIASEIQAIPRWVEMHNFYTHLLDIPDKDIQTVSWQYVVSKVMELRDAHPQTAHISPQNRRFIATQSKQRMDAHDIANRLMRRENYYIAMINKDVLDFSVNIPFIGRKDFYPPALQYLISLCLMDCVFDDHYQVKENFRTTRSRKENIILLQRRFHTCALISMVFVIPLSIVAVLLRFLESYTVSYDFVDHNIVLTRSRNTRRIHQHSVHVNSLISLSGRYEISTK
jgi:autophagy-related protein 9